MRYLHLTSQVLILESCQEIEGVNYKLPKKKIEHRSHANVTRNHNEESRKVKDHEQPIYLSHSIV